MVVRCDWSGAGTEMIEYHDKDWGVPIRDDNKLFEMLSLEGAQARARANPQVIDV